MATLRLTRWIGGMYRITDADATEALTLLYRSARSALGKPVTGEALEPAASVDWLCRQIQALGPKPADLNGTPCALDRFMRERHD